MDTQKVVAPKTLLNEGDWLEFRLLVDGHMPVQVRGRIAGFELIPFISREKYWISASIFVQVLGAAGVIAGITVLIITIVIIRPNKTTKASHTVSVPNIIGKPLRQAITQINNAGLKLGTVNRIRTAVTAGTVIFESPGSGQKVNEDTTITLVISDGP